MVDIVYQIVGCYDLRIIYLAGVSIRKMTPDPFHRIQPRAFAIHRSHPSQALQGINPGVGIKVAVLHVLYQVAGRLIFQLVAGIVL